MKYADYAVHSIKTEIKALQSILDKSFDKTFEEVIDTILNTRGQVILSGIGKPSYIAHKIAATLTSTGTPSYYIHAGEASHGDLGGVREGDTVIVLSASGESNELKDLIDYCKRFAITLVGITRNKDSYLSKMSTLPVILEAVEETTALNVPTTSSIMFLAYFDAIITTLIKVKGVDKNWYKTYHPGGKLGASMLTVGDLMYKDNELPLCNATDNMDTVIKTMNSKNLGCVGIVEGSNLIGMIADGDLKRYIMEYKGDFLNIPPTTIMSGDLITTNPECAAMEIVPVMQGRNKKNRYIQAMFVVDDKNNIVGYIHIRQLLEAGVI